MDLSIVLDLINSNKVVSGLAMVLMQFGAKHVMGDIGNLHEKILSNYIVKKIILLCMFFIATRDIYISVGMLIFYMIFIDWIFNEKNKYCLLPKKVVVQSAKIHPTMSELDYQNLKQKIKDYETLKESQNNNTLKESSYDVYIKQLNTIRYDIKTI